jgi:hypothetical protein
LSLGFEISKRNDLPEPARRRGSGDATTGYQENSEKTAYETGFYRFPRFFVSGFAPEVELQVVFPHGYRYAAFLLPGRRLAQGRS